MSDKDLHGTLEFRKLEISDLDQFNELLRYVFQVTNKDLLESGYEVGEIIRAKRPILQKADVIGWFKDDQLVSQVAVYPFEVNIHGKIFKMGGMTGVGTYPEYSNFGLMKSLIKTAIQRMREKEQFISYLYPYSVPYYREKGWEVISEHMTFNIKDSQLQEYKDIHGFVERVPVDDPDVIEVYNKYALKNHGSLIRNHLAWQEYWRWENEEERTAAIYYDENEEAIGYILYWIEEDIFYIKDMIYLTHEARKGLWNFVFAHISMIDSVKGNNYKNNPIAFLLDESQIEETIEPYFMARIIDVQKFLEQYPFSDSCKAFHFEVYDPLAEWNNGIFSLEWDKNNKLLVTNKPIGEKIKINIQTLTSMLMSFRSPTYFYEIERLETSKETLKKLIKIIPGNRPYFSDYF